MQLGWQLVQNFVKVLENCSKMAENQVFVGEENSDLELTSTT